MYIDLPSLNVCVCVDRSIFKELQGSRYWESISLSFAHEPLKGSSTNAPGETVHGHGEIEIASAKPKIILNTDGNRKTTNQSTFTAKKKKKMREKSNIPPTTGVCIEEHAPKPKTDSAVTSRRQLFITISSSAACHAGEEAFPFAPLPPATVTSPWSRAFLKHWPPAEERSQETCPANDVRHERYDKKSAQNLADIGTP